MRRLRQRFFLIFITFLSGFALGVVHAYGEDTQASRGTMANLRGVHVLVENFQPNIQKYAQAAGLTVPQLQAEIENRLRGSGIPVFNGDHWLKIPGRPVLYVNINTHQTEKYWYAYDVKLELRQIVILETNPKVKTFADTWSINITGITNIGNFGIIKKDTMVLVERFVQAYQSARGRK